MKERVEFYLGKAKELILEIDNYALYRELFKKTLDKAYQDYQHKKYNYLTYQKILDKILQGKTQKEFLEVYDNYINLMLGKLELVNSKIFYLYYEDTSFEKLEILAMKKKAARPSEAELPIGLKRSAPTPQKDVTPRIKAKEFFSDLKYLFKAKKKERKHKEFLEKRREKSHLWAKVTAIFKPREKKPLLRDMEEKEPGVEFYARKIPSEIEEIEVPEYKGIPEMEIDRKTIKREKPINLRKISREQREKEQRKHVPEREAFKVSFFSRISNAFKYRKAKPLIDEIVSEKENLEIKKESKTRLKVDNLIKSLYKLAIFRTKTKKEDFIGKEMALQPTIMSPKQKKIEKLSEIKPLSKDVLLAEAKRLRELMKKEGEVKFYSPSSLSAIANMTTRKFTLFFLEKFPNFFRSFYNTLRLANFRTLSNTYINTAVLFSFFFFVMGTVFFTLKFILGGDPLLLFLVKGVFAGIVTALIVLGAFYAYPFLRIRQRKRGVDSNLPFGITHMSAVANAGVTPTEMFRLIAASKEYGEMGVELDRLTEYIDVFGYDLVTAIRSISSVTPSQALKEFLDGLLSTVETGGDLKQFLTQKAEESMLTYKLERQKYAEVVSTYSDIYTGLLIAAPLFFVASLSLVSMLGGKIGGFDIKSLMVFSTYIIIPIMNVLFIMFLEINQPEA